jgi:hypothetical protein
MAIAIQKYNNNEKVDVAFIVRQMDANRTDSKDIWKHLKNNNYGKERFRCIYDFASISISRCIN